MKEDIKHSENQEKGWKKELLGAESSICDGLQSSELSQEETNIFGRTVLRREQPDISFICGMTLSGLRTSALIDQEVFENSGKQIRSSIRQHLPITVHIDKSDSKAVTGSIRNPELLPFPNAVQFIPTSSQEVIDLALISHKISELALVPCLNQVPNIEPDKVLLPSKAQLVDLVGNPEEQIDSPTPSQNIIFGPRRRRIPQWFSSDYPALLNSKKDKHSLVLEDAANTEYFSVHLQKIISDCFENYSKVTEREKDLISSYNVENSQFLIITVGTDISRISDAIDDLKRNKIKIGIVNINLINPFPISALETLIKNKKAITILEPHCENANWLISRVNEAALNLKNKPEILSGRLSLKLKSEDIGAIAMNMVSKKPKNSFYYGLEFTRSGSKYPKHQVLLQTIDRDYPELKDKSLDITDSGQPATAVSETSFSPITKKYQDLGPPLTRLSRFHDNTSIFYQNSDQDEYVADPFQAIPSIPAASASLLSSAGKQESFPVIDYGNCTACGSCMIQCPHSAIPSVSISLESLIKTGMEIASSSGMQIIGLLPMVKNLAKSSAKVIAGMEESPAPDSIGSIISAAFEDLKTQTKLEGKKLESVTTEFEAVIRSIENFPFTFSETFYYGPESQQKGSGELFMLAIDPNACTGCGLCAEHCDDDAITMEEPVSTILSGAREQLDFWEKLPDTSSDTINRLLYDPEYDSFAALMLSRNFYQSLTGGRSEEEDTTSRQLVHLISALTESLVQPRYSEFVKQINELTDDLSENIHSILSGSLPKENFDNIAEAIGSTGNIKVPFDEIISNISSEGRLKQVDAGEIKRKIELLNALKGLAWSLTDGPTGMGRSRMGFSIKRGDRMDWVDEHPVNPFISPVLAFSDDYTPELILGILEGQLRNSIDNIKLIRKAGLEVKNKYQPKEHDKDIASLDWVGLTDKERDMAPPLLLIGEGSLLSESNSETLNNLLGKKLPVKVFVLDDLASSPENQRTEAAKTTATLSSLVSRNSYVYQGSMASSQSMFDGIVEGMATMSPALFRLLCPSCDKHQTDSSNLPALNSLALGSRSFPSIKFNPQKYEGFLNDCIDLVNNPQIDQSWISEEIAYKEKGDDKTISFEITWADWAFTLSSWQSHFEEIEKTSVMHVSDFISSENQDGTPVIYRVKDDKLICYSVSEAIVKGTLQVKENWDLIREISGNLIKYPKKLVEQVEDQLQEKFDAELAKIKADFDAKLKEKEQEQVEVLRRKLRDKLVELTNRKK